MRISRIKLRNWRNFKEAEVADLPDVVYMIGPNASGKSNLLDAMSFLKDIAKPIGGGFQQAVHRRGGMGKLRCVHARAGANVEIEVDMSDDRDKPLWTYSLSFNSDKKSSKPCVVREFVTRHYQAKPPKEIVQRVCSANGRSSNDSMQTYLEQSTANSKFRDVFDFLGHIHYFHLVPQLIKYSEQIGGKIVEEDPFGQNFLDRVSKSKPSSRNAKIAKIEKSLKLIIPQLDQFRFSKDPHTGKPHLEAKLAGGKSGDSTHREDQFSDGTLRLISILWTCYEFSGYPIIIEDPETYLSDGISENLHWFFKKLLFQSQSGGGATFHIHAQRRASVKSRDKHKRFHYCGAV